MKSQEAFNNHFVTIVPKLASKIQSETTDDPLQYLSAEIPSDTLPFVFQRIDENLVKREINRLKCSKSPGHDQIPVKVIKDAVEIVSKPLAKIFNSFMEEGIFPDIWKLAMVTPIFKKGQKSDFCVTTGQFLYLQYCQNCSRKLFMTKFRRL